MRFKKFAVLSILTFATLILFTAAAGAVGSISGQVKLEHEVALLPVVGARVAAALDGDSNFVATTLTDSSGNYQIDNLPAGQYKVLACKQDLGCLFYPGVRHPDSAGLVAVLDGQVTSGIDFTFRPFVPPPPPNPALITGRIADAETGAGIADAWVGASGEFLDIIFQTRSGPDGRYELPVEAGGYFVRAAARGYQPGEYPGNPVRVEAYDTASNVDIALHPDLVFPSGFITGLITDSATGAHLPGARVFAFIVRDNVFPVVYETVSDTDGGYILRVPPESYHVFAEKPGYHRGEYPGNPVTVGSNDTIRGIDIALLPFSTGFGSISGQVTNDADGSPVPQALVVARQQDGFGYGAALTDSGGRYRIGPLPAGFYKVAAMARGFYPTVYPNPVEVRAGENTPDIDLRLPAVPPSDLGTISGMVTDDSTGVPIGCAVVAAVGFDSAFGHRIVRFAHTDSTGSYVIGGLPRIPYFVIAWARGYFAEIYDNVRRFADATKVTPDASGINFALEKRDSTAHSLAGIVLSNANTPLGGAFVQATDGSGAVAGAALSLPDGGFILDGLAPGSYTVSASLDAASTLQNVDLSGGSMAGINLILSSGVGLRGDVNGNGAYDPSDAVLLVNAVFLGHPLTDDRAGDVNCDGSLTPVDAVKELQLVFLGQSSAVCGF